MHMPYMHMPYMHMPYMHMLCMPPISYIRLTGALAD